MVLYRKIPAAGSSEEISRYPMPMKKHLLTNIPTSAGCYFFQGKEGEILYIGKAKNLKKRLTSYFQKKQDPKTRRLLQKAESVDFIITRNEAEALLLESRLIKKHQPRYNILFKDDKSYAYIHITDEAFPRLEIIRVHQAQKQKYRDRLYGPYPSASARTEIFRTANRLFRLRVCKKLPKRACLLYHINLCSAPCIGKISQEDYLKDVKKARMLLRGKTESLMETLRKEMREYSKQLQFEKAKIRRDQIAALEHLSAAQSIHMSKKYEQDIFQYISEREKFSIHMFHISKGIISESRDFILQNPLLEKASHVFSRFLLQYYQEHDIPEEIILPESLDDQQMVLTCLSEMAHRKVTLTIPKRGEKMKMLELLKENIFAKHLQGDRSLRELQNVLDLQQPPRIIECFDISHLFGEYMVGSMVRFRDGKRDPGSYRRFRIRTLSHQSDVDAMREIISRRYQRLQEEQQTLPDLVVVDGGIPQLSAALSVMKALQISIPVVAIAKREEVLYTPLNWHRPIRLLRDSEALKLIQRMRNEAHRFAIRYHRQLKRKGVKKQ